MEERRSTVFEKRVLRRVFGPKRDEVTGEKRKLRNGELNNLYPSPSIVWVIKSRRMRWAGHVALWARGEAFGGEMSERDHLEDRGIDGKITLR
jgi:hypothetical protein